MQYGDIFDKGMAKTEDVSDNGIAKTLDISDDEVPETEDNSDNGTGSSSRSSCQFSHDCRAHVRCQNIVDASCVCHFGLCVISGCPSRWDSEFSKYSDSPSI